MGDGKDIHTNIRNDSTTMQIISKKYGINYKTLCDKYNKWEKNTDPEYDPDQDLRFKTSVFFRE